MLRHGVYIWVVVALFGCRHVESRPAVSDRYYEVSFDKERVTETGLLPHLSEILAADAPTAMKPGRRVA